MLDFRQYLEDEEIFEILLLPVSIWFAGSIIALLVHQFIFIAHLRKNGIEASYFWADFFTQERLYNEWQRKTASLPTLAYRVRWALIFNLFVALIAFAVCIDLADLPDPVNRN